MKRKAGRTSEKNGGQKDPQLKSREILAEEIGISDAKLKRFVKIADLTADLLDLLDDIERRKDYGREKL